jgi:hypothetical protein
MYPTHSLACADGSLSVAPSLPQPLQGFDYQDAVGESLIEIMRATPGGVLVSSHVEVWGHVLCAHIRLAWGGSRWRVLLFCGVSTACFLMEWCAKPWHRAVHAWVLSSISEPLQGAGDRMKHCVHEYRLLMPLVDVLVVRRQVFFASYRMLTKCQERWQMNGMWDEMSALKAMYNEAKCNQSEFDALLARYRYAPRPFFVCFGASVSMYEESEAWQVCV